LAEVTDYYNHFSLLASIERLLGVQRLGYAAESQLPVFGSAVYDNYTPG
jgi:NADPH-dependent 7-cyano-7-deazaguanine reductase QueF-like protein